MPRIFRTRPLRPLVGAACLAATCLAAALPAQAAEVIECRLTGTSTWVPTLVVVENGREGDEVTVFDPIIKHFRGAPIRATVTVDNPRRTTFTWSVRARDGLNQEARIEYRLTRLKGDNRATISALPLGFEGPFTGQGRCTTRKGRVRG